MFYNKKYIVKVEIFDTITPEICRANPHITFLFGDNVERKGKKGQACIRNEPNAHGIPTKYKPSTSKESYFNDNNLQHQLKLIADAFMNIKGQNDKDFPYVGIPSAGLGTGLAKLLEKSEHTALMLEDVMAQFRCMAYDFKGAETLNILTPDLNLIVAGSRNITHKDYIYKKLDHFLSRNDKQYITILSGMAKGVDTIAYEYAKEHGIKCHEYPAKWDLHGRSAGYKRNLHMAKNANALLAFWDGNSRGTKHMIDIAKKKELDIRISKPTFDINVTY